MIKEQQKNQIKYTLVFSDKVRKAIAELVAQYKLERDLNMDIFELIKTNDPEVVIFNLAKRILNKEGSFKDISEILKKELMMHQKNAEKLAHEIKDKVVPLVTVVTPEGETDTENTAQEIILEKIKGANPVQEMAEEKTSLPPGVKKISIIDVEENAKKIQAEKEEAKKFGSTQFADEKKGPDSYREPIE